MSRQIVVGQGLRFGIPLLAWEQAYGGRVDSLVREAGWNGAAGPV